MAMFSIHGLYIGTHIKEADTEEAARAEFHIEHPGWAGTIFNVIEIKDDGDGTVA